MENGKWEELKCAFNVDSVSGPNLVLPLPEMLSAVEDSTIIVTVSEVQELFDEHLSTLFRLIDDQLRSFQKNHEEKVDCFVLSGGLGSSPCVQSKVKSPCEGRFEAIVDKDANMHLVKGLVQNSVDQLKREAEHCGPEEQMEQEERMIKAIQNIANTRWFCPHNTKGGRTEP